MLHRDRVAGQLRSQPLSITLAHAREAGRRAGVTRLSDVTGLTPFAVPVFQAVRPLAKTISVSQGKGLTPMAAMISALLEAVELHVSENLEPPATRARLADMGRDAVDVWHSRPRGDLAIKLECDRSRRWLSATCLMSNRSVPVPFDLVSLDFTKAWLPDVRPTSSGLATGNDRSEAAAGAVGELLERDLTELFHDGSPQERRDAEIDPHSIDDPVASRVVGKIERAGFDVRLWSLGHHVGIAAVRCVLVARGRPQLPPSEGSGCHPRRTVALIRALVEAVQVYATLVAGARDDLNQSDYDDAEARKLELIFSTLSFDRGRRSWGTVPDQPVAESSAALDALLAVAARRSSLPVLGLEHETGDAGLTVFRAVAPGLLDAIRQEPVVPIGAAWRPIVVHRQRPILFVGPTLGDMQVPNGIEVRPPAVGGDLGQLLGTPPPAVGLVDGCFMTGPSVWHREILMLIAAGVPVIGAGSLGALRAAELHDLGMIGVGRVFAAYRDGRVKRDDAVMLIHAPADLAWRPLTITLVDAEEALNQAVLTPTDRRILQRIVRTTPYTERTWSFCLERFRMVTTRPAPVEAVTLDALPSVKQADARLLIDLLQHPPPFAGAVTPALTAHHVRLFSSANLALQ